MFSPILQICRITEQEEGMASDKRETVRIFKIETAASADVISLLQGHDFRRGDFYCKGHDRHEEL